MISLVVSNPVIPRGAARRFQLLLHLSLVLGWAPPGVAQMFDFPSPTSATDAAGGGRPALFDVALESSYTGEGRGSTGNGEIATTTGGVRVSGIVPLGTRLIVPLELRYDQLWLTGGSAPVPDRVHQLHFGAGVGLRLDDRWLLTLRVSPALYKTSNVGSNDVSVSGGLMALYRHSSTFRLFLGLMVAPDSYLKVLPMAGFNWRASDKLDLHLVFPSPRITFAVTSRLRLHAGARLNMVTFRTSDSFGTAMGEDRYDDALATYRDIRVGVGFAYEPRPLLSVEADTGYAFGRRVEYTHLDETVSFESAPYVRLGLRARF